MNSETGNSGESRLEADAIHALADASLGAAFEPVSADAALAALENRDLALDIIEQISSTTAVMKSRKVRLAVAAHPRAPRRIVLRLVRELYTFDLMQFSLLPAVAADLKRVAEELLVGRLSSVSMGERVSL